MNPTSSTRLLGRAFERHAQTRSLLLSRAKSSVLRASRSSHGLGTRLVSSSAPSDSFQLLTEPEKRRAEDDLFNTQLAEVAAWWKSDRYDGIKRSYTPEDVVSKRGALQQSYPSSLMAKKLFKLFRERAVKGQPVHTSRQHNDKDSSPSTTLPKAHEG